jgi:hypothetical protein
MELLDLDRQVDCDRMPELIEELFNHLSTDARNKNDISWKEEFLKEDISAIIQKFEADPADVAFEGKPVEFLYSTAGRNAGGNNGQSEDWKGDAEKQKEFSRAFADTFDTRLDLDEPAKAIQCDGEHLYNAMFGSNVLQRLADHKMLPQAINQLQDNAQMKLDKRLVESAKSYVTLWEGKQLFAKLPKLKAVFEAAGIKITEPVVLVHKAVNTGFMGFGSMKPYLISKDRWEARNKSGDYVDNGGVLWIDALILCVLKAAEEANGNSMTDAGMTLNILWKDPSFKAVLVAQRTYELFWLVMDIINTNR